MSNITNITTWINSNNYNIIILIIPISLILCFKLKKYLKNYYDNDLLISNTPDNNLSTNLVSQKSERQKDELHIDSIENLDQEPPSYNEVI